MKKIYLLSNEFDYSKRISADGGPRYSESMLWQSDYLVNIKQYQDYVNIIDRHITKSDCHVLEEYIIANKQVNFLLTVSDPYVEYYRDNHYYKFLFRVKDLTNVFYLSKYIPTEIVQEINELTNYKKMVFIPYSFVDKYQVSGNLLERDKKIIISGADDPGIYKYRVKFFEAAMNKNPIRHPINFFFVRPYVQILKHPGYPDAGEQQIHNIIDDKYINYLSQFIFMLVTPSKLHLEFLKYSECAYARCVPVGKVPNSFSDKMKEPFLEIDFNCIAKSVQKILSIPNTELLERSRKYYEIFQIERNPDILNLKLDNFLNSVLL